MRTTSEIKDSLSVEIWKEGKIIPVAVGSYRHRVVVHCTKEGRQKAIFEGGNECPFAGYVELMNGKEEWIKQGAGMVPVLPDGRVLMVVEQRPAQGRFAERRTKALIGGKVIDLNEFGLHSSLEFPGGAVEPGQGLKAGFIAELVEETEVPNQTAQWYFRQIPFFPFGSDLALTQYLGVAFLAGLRYEERVATDGGLRVFALSMDEVQKNIWTGVICSAQAALMQWDFFKEVQRFRGNKELEKKVIEYGYLTVEEINIVKPEKK